MRVGVTTAAPSPARSVWPATPTVRPGKKQLTRAEYQSTRLRACSTYEAAPKHRSPCPPRKTNLHEDRQVGGGGEHEHQQLFAARGTWRSTGTSKEAADRSIKGSSSDRTDRGIQTTLATMSSNCRRARYARLCSEPPVSASSTYKPFLVVHLVGCRGTRTAVPSPQSHKQL